MSLPPRPLTKSALLPSAGYGKLKATKHIYVDTREAVLLDKDGNPLPDGAIWEHIYSCTDTGEERRWGMESRTIPPEFS